jgi:3-hydroxyacyl-CoA dehydrogenase
MEGVGKMEDIDTTMKVGFGLPLGPFEMADKIGLDKILKWCENLYEEFGEYSYESCCCDYEERCVVWSNRAYDESGDDSRKRYFETAFQIGFGDDDFNECRDYHSENQGEGKLI